MRKAIQWSGREDAEAQVLLGVLSRQGDADIGRSVTPTRAQDQQLRWCPRPKAVRAMSNGLPADVLAPEVLPRLFTPSVWAEKGPALCRSRVSRGHVPWVQQAVRVRVQ